MKLTEAIGQTKKQRIMSSAGFVGTVTSIAAAAAVSISAASPARACERSRLAVDPSTLPSEWARALTALDRAVDAPLQLWSCSGAVLDLHLDRGGGAELRVERRDGTIVERHVPSPDDLVPTGEAVLATLPDSTTSSADPGDATTDDLDRGRAFAPSIAIDPTPSARDASSNARTKIAIDALVVADIAGPTPLVLSGATLHAAVLRGAWGGGVWARYEVQAADFDRRTANATVSAVTLGLSARRRLVESAVEVSLGFDPSVDFVFRDGPVAPDSLERDRTQLRLGGDARLLVPVDPRWRFLVQISGEGAPDLDFDDDHAHKDATARTRSPLPQYCAGLSLGLETWVL